MSDEILSALIGFGGALIGAFLGHWFSMMQFRKEQQETLRAKLIGDRVEAYKKFLALLRPASEKISENERVVIRKDGQSYINPTATKKLFDSITNFVYSEDGASLSWKLVQEVIPTVREFTEKVIEGRDPQENGWLSISNTKAREVLRGLNWIRQKALEESGLRDLNEVNNELGLKSKK